jgi:hypothetical protein
MSRKAQAHFFLFRRDKVRFFGGAANDCGPHAGIAQRLELATFAPNYKNMVIWSHRDTLRASRTHAGF